MSCGKVYVGSIPGTVTEEVLIQHFQSIVPEADFTLVRSSIRHSSTGGFGFLTLPTHEDVKKVLTIEHNFDGRLLKCEEYLTGDDLAAYRQKLRSRRVFIRNIKKCITDQDIEEFFSQYGKVESAYIVKVHSSNKSRSFGYVTFELEEPAQKLVLMQTVEIKGIKVFVHPFQKNHESLINKKSGEVDDEEDCDLGENPTKNPNWVPEADTSIKHLDLSENQESTLYESPDNPPRARPCRPADQAIYSSNAKILLDEEVRSPPPKQSKFYNVSQVSSSRTYLASLETRTQGPGLPKGGLVLNSTSQMSAPCNPASLSSFNGKMSASAAANPGPLQLASGVLSAPQGINPRKLASGGNISSNWQNNSTPWVATSYYARRAELPILKRDTFACDLRLDEPQQLAMCLEKPTRKAYVMSTDCKYNHRLENIGFNRAKVPLPLRTPVGYSHLAFRPAHTAQVFRRH